MDLDQARTAATALMAQHGLHDWRLNFDNAKRRAGQCRYGPKEISLSRPLTAVHSPDHVTDTILHEIAHALVGPTHGHDEVWSATARRIGCTGSRCVPADAPRVEGDWVGTCPAGHRTTAHRRPERVKACNKCSDSFDLASVFTWTLGGRPAHMLPRYEAELKTLRAQAAGEEVAPPRLSVGRRVRLGGSGEYAGRVGVVEAVRRTRCVVALEDGRRLVAHFGLVQPLS